jgi:hypothetical protein
VTPRSKILYNKQMLLFRGHSTHITKVPGKPHLNDFKVWTLCDHGYLYDWLYFSGSASTLLYKLFVVVAVLHITIQLFLVF